MTDTKLYQLLQQFDRLTHNRLRKYVQSPYFNPNEKVLQLYEILRAHIFKIQKKGPDKHEVWDLLHLDKDYNDTYFRKLVSDLMKLVEGFLAQEVYDNKPLLKAAFVLQAIEEKNLTDLFDSSSRKAIKRQERHKVKDAEYYLHKYMIANQRMKVKELKSRSERYNVEEVSENLDTFYFAEKLRLYNGILSQKRVAAHNYEVDFFQPILDFISTQNESLEEVVNLYGFLVELYEEELHKDRFKRIKNAVIQSAQYFNKKEANEIYRQILNYCIRKINKGNSEYLSEYFDLYIASLENELLFDDDGSLSPWHFRSVIVTALRLGKYDWVEKFIDEYKHRLPKTQRENAVTFNTATLYFYKKEYREVISLLQAVEYDDFTYNLNSKTILLLTYYEVDEIEPLMFLADSFRAFLNRHKEIPSYRRVQYFNLIKFTKLLAKIIPGDTKALDKLQRDIDATKGIASEQWLRAKIAELR